LILQFDPPPAWSLSSITDGPPGFRCFRVSEGRISFLAQPPKVSRHAYR
jgi:hypothetical protein